MKIFLSALVFVVLTFSTSAYAESLIDEPIESFQNVINIPPVSTLVPTVVAVPVVDFALHDQFFLVQEQETGAYIGSYLPPQATIKTDIQADKIPSDGTGRLMTDKQLDTYASFMVPDDSLGEAHVTVTTATPITTSKLNVFLSQYVALPLTVEIKALLPGSPVFQTIVAEKEMTNTSITFPEIVSNQFEINFTYAQPLRISELSFSQMEEKEGVQMIRFLAQPNHSYNIYFNSDRPVHVRLVESGDLHFNDGILQLPLYQSIPNVRYIPADVDLDGIRDTLDNCVEVSNIDQVDINRNGRGDACDDFDRDGRMNNEDNCINIPNTNQLDEDGDGIGDACDTEESRFTERNPWVPWVGMGTAAVVLIVLFTLVARGKKPEDDVTIKNTLTEE